MNFFYFGKKTHDAHGRSTQEPNRLQVEPSKEGGRSEGQQDVL